MNRMLMISKIIILCVGFVLVVFLMTRLGKNGMPSGFNALFGLPEASQTSGRVAVLMKPLNWCDTRVQELELPGGVVVRQVKMKWMAIEASETRALADLMVEKWFGQHCTVNVEAVAGTPAGEVSFQPYMTVKFIKGEPVTLMRSADGLFRWKNEMFRSTELENAIAELAAQAQHATGG